MPNNLIQEWALKSGDFPTYFASQGRVYYASDADQNDVVTGQTSFADTTPTFLLSNPVGSGVAAVPLQVSLTQTGAVAGGAIDVIIEIDNADRYASSGTAETVLASRTSGAVTKACTLYSGATASAGYGVRLFGVTLGQDVSPAEGAVQEVIWTPNGGLDFLMPDSSFLVYTYAAVTGPTWFWTIKWAEVPVGEL
jgi:hypothetical protein